MGVPKSFFSPPYRAGSFFTVLGILFCCIADAFLTDVLITNGAREANPIMKNIMELGMVPFLVGKYLITACGVSALLMLRNRPLFRGAFRATDLLPLVQLFYVMLLCYEAFLLSVMVFQT